MLLRGRGSKSRSRAAPPSLRSGRLDAAPDRVRSAPWQTQRGGQQRIPRPDEFRWADRHRGPGSTPAERHLTLDDVRRRLLRSPPGAGPVSLVPDSVSAAVLVPLVEIERRDPRRVHQATRDDVDPPGRDRVPGREARSRRSTPTCGAAALREAREEIGLDPGVVEIVARLDRRRDGRVALHDHAVRRASWRPGPTLAPNPAEVVRVLEVPLSELLDDSLVPRGAVGRLPARHVGVLLRAGRRDGLGSDGAYPDRSPHAARRDRRVTHRSRLSALNGPR